MKKIAIGMLLSVVLLAVTRAAEPIRSGPPVGSELPGTFEPFNVNGPDAGEKTCILCEYGASPVAMIFARDLSEPLTRLIKCLDEATAREKERGLASSAIFLSDDAHQVQKLKQLVVREKIEHIILRTYKAEGPKDYRLAKDADVTVILFSDRVVKASRAFRKSDLEEKDIDAVIADLVKILPAKK